MLDIHFYGEIGNDFRESKPSTCQINGMISILHIDINHICAPPFWMLHQARQIRYLFTALRLGSSKGQEMMAGQPGTPPNVDPYRNKGSIPSCKLT